MSLSGLGAEGDPVSVPRSTSPDAAEEAKQEPVPNDPSLVPLNNFVDALLTGAFFGLSSICLNSPHATRSEVSIYDLLL